MGNALRLGIARVGLALNQWKANRCLSKKTIVILILGLQETGKSTIALRLWKLKKTLPDPQYVQTKGFNTYEIRKRKLTVRLHDLGGHESIRELWEHYYADAHGVIFVVDSSKPDEAVEAGDVLAEVLKDERMQRKPALVILNKQDLPTAQNELELTKAMDLLTLANSARCLTRVDACSAIDLKDPAIFAGFKWLQTHIETHYLEMNTRVLHDSSIEREKEKAKLALRRNEVRRIKEQTSLAINSRSKTPRETSLRNDENQLSNDDEVDEGIEQVQKPAEVTSIDGENNVETTGTTATVKTKSRTSNKIQDVNNGSEMLIENRLSPEGAAEDMLKPVDNINANSHNHTNLITNINNKPHNNTDYHPQHINSQSFNTNDNNSSGVPTNSQSNHNQNNNNATHIASSATANKSGHHHHHHHQRRPSRVITPPPRRGHDNPAFEPNVDDQETSTTHTHNRSNSSSSHRIIMDKKFSYSRLPVRSSAISIRSNSTETDIEVPGEIILVTTKAEVHETQEMADDYHHKLDMKDYEPHDQNVSPISYISGHVSHRTSQESIASAVLVNTDSIAEIIEQDNKSRASSASVMNHVDQNNHLSKPTKPTPLQKLANLKSRNKTAPIDIELSASDQINGNINEFVQMKKTDSARSVNP